MNFTNLYHSIPLVAVYFLSVALVLLALAFGIYLGKRYAHAHKTQQDSSFSSAVAATLGLLAFLLAFTFNMAAERYNQRKTLMLEEVNVVATTYLRADFLDEQGQQAVKPLLAEYAVVRHIEPGSIRSYDTAIQRSEALHAALWAEVRRHIQQGYDPGLLRMFAAPLNQLIDLHNVRRVVSLEFRIPPPIWMALDFITVMAMIGVGFQFGVSRSGSIPMALGLAMTFATVILLIGDLDRTTEGLLVIHQKPMLDLVNQLQAMEAARLSGQ